MDVWWHQTAVPGDAGHADLMRALDDLAQRATPDSVMLFVAPERLEPFLHYYRLSTPLVGLAPDRVGVEPLRNRLLTQYSRILLLTDAGQTDPHNRTEAWLEANAYRARNEFYADWRVAVFGVPLQPTAVLVQPARFGGLLSMAQLEYGTRVQPGGAVPIRVQWQRLRGEGAAQAPVPMDGLAWYAHLIAPDGSLVAQHDALVGDAYSWGQTDSLEDHRGILVPLNALPGTYRVNIGMYGPGGQRIPAVGEHGPLPHDIVSFDVQVP
jgi:hypothetical protein